MPRRRAEPGELTLTIEGRACRIVIGNGILGEAGGMICGLGKSRYALVTSPAVNALYGDALRAGLDACNLDHETFEVPDSEAAKSLGHAEELYGLLSEHGFGRDSAIIGLGGGTVGDLAGFVAATYMRGLDLLLVPTTMLAQVDSAIGGKTAVNLPGGKNLVGAFHHPLLVISDVGMLSSLPDTEYRSGLAEVLKYGLACDPKLFRWLEGNSGRLRSREGAAMLEAVRRCSAIKARIVERDPRDMKGRLALNLGHTLGHALEAATGYSRYRHGEAVAIGMVFASRLSVEMGLLPGEGLERLESLMGEMCLPVSAGKGLNPGVLLDLMAGDKKAQGGRLRMVLPAGIGKVALRDDLDEVMLLEILGSVMD